MNVRELANAIALIKSTPEDVLKAFLADQTLEKSMEGLRASGLGAAEVVRDHWTEGELNKAPAKEQIKVGPVEESSGGGADRMVRQYSNPAPQHGTQLTAEHLADMLAPINSSLKAVASALTNQSNVLKAVGDVIVTLKADPNAMKAKKAGEDEEDEEEDEEESEVVEINASRGKSRLNKAVDLLRKARAKKTMADEETDEKACAALIAESKTLRKSARQLLAKALTNAYAANDAELKKAIRKAAGKADINVVQEEEEDEEEEEEGEGGKARKAQPAEAKAKVDDAGNQADHADMSNGNQAAHAKAEISPAVAQRLEDAMKGIAMLNGDIKTVMDIVSGKSKASALVPDIMKAAGPGNAGITDFRERLEEMRDDMSPDESMACEDILTKIELAQRGQLDATVVQGRIEKSTARVRAVFNPEKIAA